VECSTIITARLLEYPNIPFFGQHARSKPAISTTPGEILKQERLGKRLEREVKVLAVA
jgi:hypothetical protein